MGGPLGGIAFIMGVLLRGIIMGGLLRGNFNLTNLVLRA
jgi:hypothetical protein